MFTSVGLFTHRSKQQKVREIQVQRVKADGL